MNARRLLAITLFFLVSLSVPFLFSAPETRVSAGRVTCDIDPLRSVIVFGPSEDDRKEVYMLYSDSPMPVLAYAEGMARQHAAFTALLKKNGVRALSIVDLLEDAIVQARRQGKLEAALQEIFPDQFPRLAEKLDEITARVMLGRDPAFFFNYNDQGGLDPLVPLTTALIYTRDFAVSTPRGILITNGRPVWRKFEHRLGRFIFRFATALRDYPIVFDAEAEGVRCDGGDIIVKDEHTLLMGIGNFSDREAAVRIAQRLDLDVVGVSMPPSEGGSGANFEIMHLDTVFNLVDAKKALAVPFLFWKKYAADQPILKLFQAVNSRPQRPTEKGEYDIPVSLKAALEAIPQVGWLTLFKAGTGEAQDLETKLGDYLADQGYEIVPVGGEQGDLKTDLYLDDRVLYELSLQGANVVQLGPGRVVAYAHNKYTNEALRRRGVKVLTFEGKYLADGMGGPHCLTMPVVRQK